MYLYVQGKLDYNEILGTTALTRIFCLLYQMFCYVSRLKGEVQSRITIISKERVKISLQIGAKIMKIG